MLRVTELASLVSSDFLKIPTGKNEQSLRSIRPDEIEGFEQFKAVVKQVMTALAYRLGLEKRATSWGQFATLEVPEDVL
ncbi:hypothetical protein APED_33265 [Acanthopleuribacter pedis]